MKTTTLSLDDRDEQAAYWAMRLDGSELSAADRARLDAWIAADPANRAALAEYCQLSADLEQQMPLLEGIRDETAETHTALHAARPSPWLRRPVLAGVVLTAAAAVALLFWTGPAPAQRNTLATAVAERRTLALADGSAIELNARTSLVIELGRDQRRARLETGEAFFAVAKDPGRPFVVETPAGAVRVTGTQFSVRTDATGALAVTVAEGSVEAAPTARPPVALVARQQFTADPAGSGTTRFLTPEALDDALAWRRGQAVFRAMPLGEALAHFARYHGRELSAAGAAADRKIGGTYRLDDLDGFLRDIQDAFPVRVETDARTGAVRVLPRD